MNWLSLVWLQKVAKTSNVQTKVYKEYIQNANHRALGGRDKEEKTKEKEIE